MISEKVKESRPASPPPVHKQDMPLWMRQARPWVTGVLALGVVAVFALSIAQLTFLRQSENAPGSMAVAASASNPNIPDHRGLYLQLTDGTFQELLPVTEGSYVVPFGAANFKPGQVKWAEVSASMNFSADQYRIYKLYRDGSGSDVLTATFQVVQLAEDKVVRFAPADGNWPPGAYLLDTSSDEMTGGRTYGYFIIGDWVTPVVPKNGN